MNHFHLNYVSAACSPFKSFLKRDYLKGWQVAIILLVLNAMMLFPLSLQIGQLKYVNLEDYAPQSSQLIDGQLINELQKQTNETTTAPTAFELTREKGKANIRLTDQSFELSESKGGKVAGKWLNPVDWTTINQPQQLKQLVTENWLAQNRIPIALSLLMNISILTGVSLLLVWLGTTVFLYLTKFSKMFSITTWREAWHVSLNWLFLPTAFAMIIGFITKNPGSMLTFHGFLYVGMILWSYWKTHLNDAYAKRVMNQMD
ncbi:hypothetical protein [Atopobacter phocae]|uniref:hypothetical protein n=1 Tax=Atopobacter phocae TaxID=136492 RepID=UPI00047145F8|nr:hypothetical protein [Atopobacter phocae]